MGRRGFLFEDIVIMVFFILIIFIKLLSLNFDVKIAQYSNIFSIFGILGSILVLTSFLFLFSRKSRTKIFLVLNLVITLILLADVIYNRYFFDITSVALIYQVRLATEVKESVKAQLRLGDLKYFIDILTVSILYFIAFRKRNNFKETRFKYRIICFISFFTVGIMFTGISVNALERNQPQIMETFYDKKFIESRIGELNFHAFDFYRYVSNNCFLLFI
jgi:hypothetical protein